MEHPASCTCFTDCLKFTIGLSLSDFGGDENLQNLASFLLSMLQIDSQRRMPVKELLRHPFLTGGNQLRLIGGMCAMGRNQHLTDGV